MPREYMACVSPENLIVVFLTRRFGEGGSYLSEKSAPSTAWQHPTAQMRAHGEKMTQEVAQSMIRMAYPGIRIASPDELESEYQAHQKL
jgi:hypothetical protein